MLKNELLLQPKQLRKHVDKNDLDFEHTKQVQPLKGTIGQPRAVNAIEFGIKVRSPGYNLYISGWPGSGRETTVKEYVEKYAKDLPNPVDWVYAHHFDNPDNPRAIKIPSGHGAELVHDLDEFIRLAQRHIPRAFESEDYERKKRETLTELNQDKAVELENLHNFAKAQGFAIEITPGGFVTIPLDSKGDPIPPESFEKFEVDDKSEFKRKNQSVHTEIANTLRRLRLTEKNAQDRIKKLDQDVTEFAVGPLLEDLREKYSHLPAVVEHLNQIQKDLLQHLNDLKPSPEREVAPMFGPPQKAEDPYQRYRLNLFVDNTRCCGAPVIFERNPTYYNLIGRVNYRPTFGAMVTDFLQIKPGALHRANGGFLVLHIVDVLKNPFAWEAIKRALLNHEVRIENMGEQYTVLPTASLRPEAIPIDVKIILIGAPQLHQLLHLYDEDFQDLFKVKADFTPEMHWSKESVTHYAQFISRCINENSLKDFDASGVCRIIEEGARLRDNQRKLSTRLSEIRDLVVESSFWANQSAHEYVQSDDVEKAISQKEYRSNLVEERYQELITENTIMIDTEGEKIGQVNGMAVLQIGDYTFGKPSRITAAVSLGKGTFTSIDREIKLSGPIHSKGFLILSGYLAHKYAQQTPLAVSATITFEQSYDEIEGDSASSTELYGLLSALSGAPLKQGIAVTGSVNQRGEVQAVGGVTRKIEGFFDVCKEKGITGQQGVIIPRANAHTLMLKPEIIKAVEEKKFFIWAVSSIDEGIEILSGIRAGTIGPDGRYESGTINGRAAERLSWYAEQTKNFRVPTEGVVALGPQKKTEAA